jgi:membrane-bound acyltransferase YfiQ involved in biofilm formation
VIISFISSASFYQYNSGKSTTQNSESPMFPFLSSISEFGNTLSWGAI